jgi:soluble lytic murein transglycosylase-like protein
VRFINKGAVKLWHLTLGTSQKLNLPEMRIIYLISLSLALAAAPLTASAQSRVFDNFDTAAGVNVVYPPAPPAPKLVKKRNAQGKWVVVVEDKLVQKTASVKRVANVTDGLATREGGLTTKLIMGSTRELKGFTTGDATVDSYIVDSSRRYSIDPLLIYSQMHQESTFKLRAMSPKGARGLMQLMPGTARRFGVDNIYDAKQNIDGGVRYMRFLLDMFGGDVNLALAGYNAGEGAVMRYGNQIPPYRETQEYVRRISNRYNMISNPQYIQTARTVSGQVASKLENKKTRPLNIYEPGIATIRLPDGRLTLVNQ